MVAERAISPFDAINRGLIRELLAARGRSRRTFKESIREGQRAYRARLRALRGPATDPPPIRAIISEAAALCGLPAEALSRPVKAGGCRSPEVLPRQIAAWAILHWCEPAPSRSAVARLFGRDDHHLVGMAEARVRFGLDRGDPEIAGLVADLREALLDAGWRVP